MSLLAHLIGDYILQTDHQATQKTSHWWPAILHGVTYTLPFILITHSLAALLVISVTHIIIDRYRLAKYLIWFKNQFAPKEFRPPRSAMLKTGYSATTPDWLAVWLMIIADNSIHLVINALSIAFLGSVWIF